MGSQLTWKFVFIAVVIIVCIFGVIGLPTSLGQVKQNVADRIRLGLDL
jgi:hypothetical protein